MEVGWKVRVFGVCDGLSDDVSGVNELWGVDRWFILYSGVSEDHLGGRLAHSTNLL